MQEDGTQEVLKKACKEMVAPRAAPGTGEMSLTAAGTRLPPVEVCEKPSAPWPPPWNPGGVMTMPLGNFSHQDGTCEARSCRSALCKSDYQKAQIDPGIISAMPLGA
jgi:hypothetical protein